MFFSDIPSMLRKKLPEIVWAPIAIAVHPQSAEPIPIFKSVDLAVQDVVAALEIYRRAQQHVVAALEIYRRPQQHDVGPDVVL